MGGVEGLLDLGGDTAAGGELVALLERPGADLLRVAPRPLPGSGVARPVGAVLAAADPGGVRDVVLEGLAEFACSSFKSITYSTPSTA